MRQNRLEAKSYEILIADHNLDDLKLLTQVLIEKGYKIRQATGGIQAFESVMEKAPDLILFDAMLSDANSFDICEKLKAEATSADIPILFMSDLDTDDVLDKVFLAGGLDYIKKPFNIQDVADSIAWALEMIEISGTKEQKNYKTIKHLAKAKLRLQQEINLREQGDEARLESENRLSYALEATKDGLWDWNIVGNKVYFSDQYYQMLGYEPSDFEPSYENWFSRIHENDLELARSTMQKALDSPCDFDFQYRMRCKSGEWKWILSRGKVVAWTDEGAPIRIIGTHIDVSDRKYEEERIRMSEVRMNLAAHSGNIGIWDWDIENNVLVWDDSMYNLYGIKKDEFGGAYEAWRQSLYPDDREMARQATEAALSGKCAYDTEFRIVRADGAIRNIKATSVVSRDLAGNPLRMIGINTDITEIKQAQELLRRGEQRYRQLVDAIPNTSFLLFDREHRFIISGGGENQKHNFDNALIEGKTLREAYPKDIADLFEPFYKKALLGESHEFEMSYGDCLYSQQVLPVKDEEQNIFAGMVIATNITDKRESENELLKYRNHLEDLVAQRTKELEMARDMADTANRAKSIFLANMSHEIRTPMNAVLGFAQLLMRDADLSEKAYKSVQAIMNSGEHLLLIINDILEMSRIEAGRVVIRNESVNLRSMLEDLAGLYRLRAEEKKLILHTNFSETLPRYILTDMGKLRQIMTNLLCNAVKFTNQGEIVLSAYMERPDWMVISVKDTGIGIAEHEKSILFKPFERTQSGEETAGGTGLGLAISREYAHLLGGDISVKSSVGKGSIFEFGFKTLVAEAPPTNKSNVHRTKALASGQGRVCVLVVDDERTNRELLKELLMPMGFEVELASSGEEAITLARKSMPRVIFMDLVMPGMNGIEAADAIRSLCPSCSTTIIGLSASAYEEDRMRFMEAGVNAFVAKPYYEQELFDVMSRYAGIQFETEVVNPHVSMAVPATAGISLENIPQEWCQNFKEALAQGSISKMKKLGDEVHGYDPGLSDFVAECLELYDLESLKKVF